MIDFHTAPGDTQMPHRIQTGNALGVGATPLNIDMKPKKNNATFCASADDFWVTAKNLRVSRLDGHQFAAYRPSRPRRWALDASKAVEKPDPIPAPQPRRHGHRWLLRTIAFVGAACATFLALAPRPAFASVVAPVACWAGLEVCGVCGPTCDAVCTH